MATLRDLLPLVAVLCWMGLALWQTVELADAELERQELQAEVDDWKLRYRALEAQPPVIHITRTCPIIA